MASTTRTSMIPERDASLQVLSSLLDRLDEKSVSQLEQYIQEIEEQIVRTIDGVSEKKLGRKNREAVLSAAVYDTFLLYEDKTKVKVRTPLIAETFGISECAVNKNWRTLFDNRVRLDTSRIEIINSMERNPKRLVNAVIRILRGAARETSPELEEWFVYVSEEAKEMLSLLDRKYLTEYPPDILALVAVYGVIKNQGKPLVPLSQKQASLMCGISPAMISLVLSEVFNEGSISGSSNT